MAKSLAKRVRFAGDSCCQAVRVFRPKDESRGDEETIGEYRLSRVSDGFSLCSSLPREFKVSTMYKRKADKVRPVDCGKSDGDNPGGVMNWVEISKRSDVYHEPMGKYSKWLIPKFSDIERGSRLTEERISKLKMGTGLTKEERELFVEMLYNREKALAFDFSHCGMVRAEVAPPQVIKTVEHKAWQCPGFPIPKALLPTAIEMLKARIARGVLEYGHGPYRNPWFLAKKKEPNAYRLINSAIEMNRQTIRDANLPPSVDEFSEEFAGCKIASLIDFFSGYDQVELDVKSRDLTAFQTPLGLLRQTRLPMGATNSVAQFVRIVTKILEDRIPEDCLPFVDDIGIKGPMSCYDNEEVCPGVRRYILEHIQSLDRTIERLERAGCTIGTKSQFYIEGIRIVGFVYDTKGRSPDSLCNRDRCQYPSSTAQ
jgi:hypothetical protein